MEHPDLAPRAGRILRRLGLPDAGLEPVESYSHAVWLTRDHAVHYHVVGPPGRLEHAARVAARLPPAARYPAVVAVGRDGAHDWLVTRRVPGVPLSVAWPALRPAARRAAIHQAAAALRAVHGAPAQDLVPPCLQGGAPVLSRRALAERLRGLGLPPAFAGLLAAAGDAPAVLVHGDFGFNQVLWDGGRVTALLDLEMAHAEAPDWDLGTFLGTCLDPARVAPAHVAAASRPDDYREAPTWLREAYPELFAAPALRERLALQALVLRWPELRAAPDRREAILETAVAWAATLEPWLR